MKHIRDSWLRLWLGDTEYNSQDEEQYRRHILVVISTLWLLLVIAISVVVRIFVDFRPEGRMAADAVLVISAVAVFIGMGLLRVFGSRHLALNTLLAVIAGAFTAACFYFGGMQSPTMPALLLIPITAGIAGSRASGISWSVIIAVIWITLFVLDRSDFSYTQIIIPANYNIAILMTYIGLGTTVISVILVYAEMNKDLRSVLQQANKELDVLSRHDALTGLPNRRYYEEHFDTLLTHAADSGTMVGMLFFDLDGFKAINDRHGHSIGDRLLVRVAERLLGALRETDMVARLGGDEFVVVIENVTSSEEVVAVGEKLAWAIEQPITVRRLVLNARASFGVVVYPLHGAFRKELEAKADKAMYQSKGDTGRVTLAG